MGDAQCGKLHLCLTVLGKVEEILDLTRELLNEVLVQGNQGRGVKGKGIVKVSADQFAPMVEKLLKHIDDSEVKLQMEMNRLLDQADNSNALSSHREI